MVLLKFKCEDRNYESWELYNAHFLSLEDKTKYEIKLYIKTILIKNPLKNTSILYSILVNPLFH